MKTFHPVARIAFVCAAALTLTACDDDSFDVQSQIGPNPNLPAPQQYLFPPMHLASVVGWKPGEKPTVAKGLKIEALATDLQHPRSLYVLPNGDVLVVESKAPGLDPVRRPKDFVMGLIESLATSGGKRRQAQQSDHAPARRRRGQTRDPERLSRSPVLALRRGTGRLRSLCRQYRRDSPLHLQYR